MNIQWFDHALDAAFRWTCATTLAATALIALVLIAQAIFGRVLPARWRYALGLLVLLRLVLPAAPSSSLSIFNLASRFTAPRESGVAPASRGFFSASRRKVPLPDEEAPAAPSAPTATPLSSAPTPVAFTEPPNADSGVAPASRGSLPASSPEAPGATTDRARPHFTLRASAKYLWLLGSAAILFTVARRHRKFSASLRSWEPVREPRVLELLESCQSMLGLRRRVIVLAAESLNTPALFGLLRPRLLVPVEMLHHLDDRELRHIFLHELVHLRRGDLLVNWAMIALRALHWFNPAVWLAFRRLRADQELACDAAVLAHLDSGEQLQYGNTLVKLLADFSASGLCPGVVPFATNKQIIKHRIKSIAAFKPAGRLAAIFSTLLVAALACVTFTRAAVSPQAPASQATIFPLLVQIANDGTISLDGGRSTVSIDQFRQMLEAIQAESPQEKANILPAVAAPAEKVKQVVDLLQSKGITAIWLRTPAVPLNAGMAAPSQSGRTFPAFYITIDPNGAIWLGSNGGFTQIEKFRSALADKLAGDTNRTAIVRADSHSPFRSVSQVLDALRENGVARVGITTDPFANFATSDAAGDATARSGDQEQLKKKLADVDAQIDFLKQRLQSSESISAQNYAQVPQQVQAQINAAAQRIREKQALLSQLNNLSPDELRQVLPTTVPDPLLTDALRDLASVQSEVAKLSATVGPGHPDLRTAQALAAQANSNVTSRVKGILKGMQVQIDADNQLIRQLKEQLSDSGERAKYEEFLQFKSDLDKLERQREDLRKKMDTIGDPRSSQAAPLESPRGIAALKEELAKLDLQVSQTESNMAAVRKKMLLDSSRDPGDWMIGGSVVSAIQIPSDIVAITAKAAQLETILSNLDRMDSAEKRQAIPVLYPDDTLNVLLKELADNQSQLAAMSTNAPASSPTLKALKALVRDKNEQIDSRVNGLMLSAHAQLDAARAQIAKLKETLDETKTRQQDTAKLATTYYESSDKLEQLKKMRDVIQSRLDQELSDSTGGATNQP